MEAETRTNNKDLLVLLLLTGLGTVGWVKFLFLDYIFPLDWLERVIILGVYCHFYRDSISLPGPVSAYLNIRNFLSVILAVIFLFYSERIIDFATSITQLNLIWVRVYFPGHKVGLIKSIDLTAGVLLVALTEELVYRKLALRVIT